MASIKGQTVEQLSSWAERAVCWYGSAVSTRRWTG